VSGLSKQLLSFIVRGERRVADEVYRQIADGLINEADRVRGSPGKLDKLAVRMLRELEE
jgi:hypothetical protein